MVEIDLIEAHVRWCKAGGMSKRTVEDREGCLRRLDQALHMGIQYVVSEELETWFGNPRWSAATRFTYFGHAWGLYTWADGRYIDFNPMQEMRRPRRPRGVPRPISEENLARILAEADEPYRTAYLIAATTGLRCKEIAGLYREDLDEEWIYIREAKGGDDDVVPNHPDVWQTIKDFPPGSLVAHLGGVPDARWLSQKASKHFSRKLGLTKVGLHRGRHRYATQLRLLGHDLFVIKENLRHRSVSSTEIYVQVTKEERRAATRTLPSIATPVAC